jgi:acyl carrier protein
LGKPARTAEVFTPDPYATVPGARLYKTGDRVRYGTGGVIQFIGRIDHQIKLRGFRIELSEIEAGLMEHEAVKDAAVTVNDHGGDASLVAHLIPHRPDDETAETRIRERLRETLPAYMVPGGFRFVEALPLTPNGKVDRKALAAVEPHEIRASAKAAYVAPANPVETALAEMWCQVLGRDRVGTADNFFDLGGHSILLVRLHRRIQAELAPQLTMVDLFQNPTIADLARHLGENQAKPDFSASTDRAQRKKAAFNKRKRRGSRNGR